ncbi:hypothetical protein BGX27_005066 [Mortierella sp. AM989]|nr:hypothetical protein BGX27_005066 [Mortierella sp. AM989]
MSLFGQKGYQHYSSNNAAVEFHYLEDYALKPESRQDLAKSWGQGTREYYVSQLRLLSQELQEAAAKPSTDATAAASFTAERVERAVKLLREAEPYAAIGGQSVWEQFKAQFAILGYSVNPDLLLKELAFNPDTIIQLNTSATATTATSPAGGEQLDICDSLPTTLDESLFDIGNLTQQLMDKLVSDFNTRVPDLVWPHLLAQPQMRKILLETIVSAELKTQFLRMDIGWSSKSLEMLQDNASNIDSSWSVLNNDQRQNQIEVLIADVVLRLYREERLNFTENHSQYANLTNAQLELIKEKEPGVMNNEGFVGMLEKRIIPRVFDNSPSQETGKAKDPRATVHGEWLTRMIAFVDVLPPKYNRHRMAVYLMSLEYDIVKGVIDRNKFMKFIAIPRNHSHYNTNTLKKYYESDSVNNIVNTNNAQDLTYWSDRVKPATKARDEEIVKECLTHLLAQEKSSAAYEEYFEHYGFLNPLLARVMLYSGDQDILKWSAMLAFSDMDISRVMEQTVIKFAYDNNETFLPSDPVVFKLKVKNAKRILIRVFEIKTLEYLQQHGNNKAIGQVLNLDGLTPNWEKYMMLDHPPLEMHDLTIDLPELADRRGAFVMDVISNGENSSAYFTKGYLDYIERQSVAGHVLTIIDENKQKIVQDVSVWFNGFNYKTNSDGDIVIPYRNLSVATEKDIYITCNDFTSRLPFSHRAELYDMELSCYIDHESLVAGAVAKVLLKATVCISGINVTCPVELLEQVVLEVQTEDTSGIEGTTTVSDFKLYDSDWTEYNFQVPENLAEVSFTLTAKIKVLSTGKFEDLNSSKHFPVESNDCDNVVAVHVQSRKQNVQVQSEVLTVLRALTTNGTDTVYEILAFGKNGEKRPNIPLEVGFVHAFWLDQFDVFLRTDSEGIIRLGKLENVTKIKCNRNSWNLLSKRKHSYPEMIHSTSSEPISLPFSRNDVLFIRSISLFKRSPEIGKNRCLLEDCTSNIKLGDGLLSINHLSEGYYKLILGDECTIEVIVSSAKSTFQPTIKGLEEFNIESNPMLQIQESVKCPLYMSSVVNRPSEENIRIQVHNWTPATRICLVATKFLPYMPIFGSLASLDSENPWLKRRAERTTTTFRVGRVLGEEYQYILNRKAQSKHWAGNLLLKPSVLLNPWSIGETTMSREVMADQNLNNVSDRSNTFENQSGGGGGKGKGGAKRHRKILPPGAHPLLAFLNNPSLILANLIPDQNTGVLEVPYSKFKEENFLQILVTDGTQAIQQSLAIASLTEREFQKRDLRFKSPLDYSKHYIGERIGVKLDPKQSSPVTGDGSQTEPSHSITLPSNGSSSSAVRVINSVSQVYDLMMTLLESEAHRQTLRKFGFIVDWHKLSNSAKNEKFSRWSCHELNLFLYKKDRPFFDAVVLPFIKNKLIKSFVDDFLIGASLEKYTSLREFNLLKCMEKCLLAYRIPRLRPSVAKWIRSRVRNTKVTSDVKLFRTVMRSGTTDEELEDGIGGDAASPLYFEMEDVLEEEESSEEFELVDNPSIGPQMQLAQMQAQMQSAQMQSAQMQSALTQSAQMPIAAPVPPQRAPGFSFGSAPVASGSTAFGFGATAPSTGFGARPQTAPATSLFGQSSTQGSLFAQSQAPAAGGLFGQPSTQGSLFAQSQAPAAGGLFSFGSTSLGSTSTVTGGSSLFGSTTAQTASLPPPPQANIAMNAFGGARTIQPQPNMAYQQKRAQTEEMMKQQQKPVDLTKEMAETYYWGRQDSAYECGKKDVNAFWLDFVEWDESEGGSFLSENFVANTKTFTDAMATIALLDVTFKPKDASIGRSSDQNLVISSSSPAIEVREVSVNGAVIVTQQYFERLEKTEYDPRQMADVRRYIQPDIFIPLESYGAHVVVMNATPNPMKLHLEVQLPQGSISIYDPLESGQDIHLEAHGTFQYEYHFYFPSEGDFPHYAPHASDYENIVAFANPSIISVRESEPGQIKNAVDITSWSHILARGTHDQVLDKLKSDPLEGIRDELLIPRLYRDRELLKSVTDVLRDRHEYNDRIWSVSLMLKETGDKDVMRLVSEYMANKPIIHKLGYWFTSALVTRKPSSRYETAKGVFHYLEYFPLINARVHKANKKVTILNDRFKEQYIRFLNLLSQKPRHDVEDLLVLIVYLLAQDRILEAKEFFAKLSVLVKDGHLEDLNDSLEQLPEGEQTSFQQIQYDYLRAYLSLCVEVQVDASTTDLAVDLDGIQSIVSKYQNYPVQRWSRLFKDMKIYVDEILRTTTGKGKAASVPSNDDFEQDDAVMVAASQESLTTSLSSGNSKRNIGKNAVAASVDFKIGSDNQITIHHQGVEQIIVEYYAIDAEAMFSAAPLTFSDQGEREINVAASGATSAGAVAITKQLLTQQVVGFGSSAVPAPSDTTSYRFVKPNGIDKHTVEFSVSDDAVLKVPILENYLNTNVMISVMTSPPAATKTWKASYSQTISVKCHEATGTIKVVTKATSNNESQPIRGGYVKVYAEMKNIKETLYWKDGYTDLVGRFNYATVSTATGPSLVFSRYNYTANNGSGGNNGGGLANVKRFVLFVDGGKEGCVVKTVPVPPA